MRERGKEEKKKRFQKSWRFRGKGACSYPKQQAAPWGAISLAFFSSFFGGNGTGKSEPALSFSPKPRGRQGQS